MEFIKSQRGKSNMIYNHFLYNLSNSDDLRCYWRCSQSKCNVTMITEDQTICKQPNIHQHANHDKKVEKLKARLEMIDAIEKSPNLSIKQHFNLVRTKRTLDLVEKDEDMNLAPRFNSMKSSLYSYRNSLYPQIQSNNIALPILYKQTLDKQNFLIYNDSNIMVFSSPTFLNWLAKTDRIYVDGTFASVPREFKQLFTIHILIQNDMFPAVYVLLPDKKMETYFRLIGILTSIMRNIGFIFKPIHLHCDFEAAIIKAFTTFFPEINIHGCYFHFSQCLYRKVQNLGLKKLYEDNNEFKCLFKRCIALPLIAPSDLDVAWYLINELNLIEDERVDKFIYYIQATWLDSHSLFHRESWNHYGNFGTRTTNHLEGFHSKLNKSFNYGRPKLLQLIDQLRNIEFEQRIDLSHVLDGQKIRQKNKRYIEINENYKKYYRLYNDNSIDLLKYIDLVSRLM